VQKVHEETGIALESARHLMEKDIIPSIYMAGELVTTEDFVDEFLKTMILKKFEVKKDRKTIFSGKPNPKSKTAPVNNDSAEEKKIQATIHDLRSKMSQKAKKAANG